MFEKHTSTTEYISPHHLISSFAPFIITMATRGLKINMGHNKLLAQTTHKAVFVQMRMVKRIATVCINDRNWFVILSCSVTSVYIHKTANLPAK